MKAISDGWMATYESFKRQRGSQKKRSKEGEMSQIDLFNYQQSLFERICSLDELKLAFELVKRNGGAPGVDGVTVKEFEERLSEELVQLKKDLESWVYEPSPVRRVEIPKPDGAGVRMLGIPTVRDRVLHAAIKAVIEPIFDPLFSEHSYGFRPKRNQKQAVLAAQRIVQSGKEHVVDIDLAQFFDRIHHDRLIHRLGLQIQDKRVLRLIGLTLRSGIMKDGMVSATMEGSVQGSPLSPLLSNVVLDELDRELERRGLEFCRYADDCNIFVRSRKAAERVMETVTRFIERRLKLVVNREKSKVALSKAVKFLGMTIIAGTIAISAKSMQRAMDKVKSLTPRGTSLSIEQTVEKINRWYVGWASYYKMTQYPRQMAVIEAHLRRRLRSRLVSQQKKRRHLFERLKERGVPKGLAAKDVYSNKKRWALSHSHSVERAYPNRWFIHELGQEIVSNETHPHWFPLKTWIKLS
jgi:group II intron reverse transcriptase/maturase